MGPTHFLTLPPATQPRPMTLLLVPRSLNTRLTPTVIKSDRTFPQRNLIPNVMQL